jgi:hypothetical protein
MECIESISRGLRNFLMGFNENMEQITKDNEELIVSLNVDQQDVEGVNNKGEPIRPPYAPSTIRYKRRKGQPTDHVTLHDTGRFHDTFQIRYDADGFELYASDAKQIYLRKRYGNEIYGLTDEAARELADEVYQPRMLEYLKRAVKEG